MAKKPLEEKDISAITVGTYIVEIVEQTGKTKLAGAGWVGSKAILEKFKAKGIKRVLVDPNKYKGQGHELIQRQAFFKEEIRQARDVFNRSKEISRKVFDDAATGKNLDVDAIQEVTDKAIDAVFDNPDALACVVNIRNKDEYLLEHSVSVSVLITIFAKHLGIPKDQVRDLAVGGFLHDVGKIRVPDEVLNKPGRLTDEEFDVMKMHVTHSIDIIMDTEDVPQTSLEVAALHHEKLSGLGYPIGLSGDDITKFGRMITICDVFDALCANRCYKEGLPQVKAFTILREMANNGDLDKKLVDEFIRCMGVYPVGSLVLLSSKHLAVVEGKTPGDPTHPKVNVFYDLENKKFENPVHIDLAKVSNDEIVKCTRPDDFDLDMGSIMDFLEREA